MCPQLFAVKLISQFHQKRERKLKAKILLHSEPLSTISMHAERIKMQPYTTSTALSILVGRMHKIIGSGICTLTHFQRSLLDLDLRPKLFPEKR
jgi:hypothetical protein